MQVKFILAMTLSLFVFSSNAALFEVTGDGADRAPGENGWNKNWVGEPYLRVGRDYDDDFYSMVYVFELPELPDGEFVDTAGLSFYVHDINHFGSQHLDGKGIDLYGVRMASSAGVELDDFFSGSFAATGNNGVGIQESIVFTNTGQPDHTGTGWHQTDPTGSANLGSWLQGLYDDPGYNPAGDNFAFLRLSDQGNITTSGRFWEVRTANAGSSSVPVLTIETAIPEPASVSLLALAGLSLFRRLRRHC